MDMEYFHVPNFRFDVLNHIGGGNLRWGFTSRYYNLLYFFSMVAVAGIPC